MDQFVASTVTAVGLSIDPNSLKSLFDDLGVEKPSDVGLLCEADLIGLLKTVHARKVIAYFKSLDSLVSLAPDDAAPVPSESVGVCVGTSDVVIARPVCTVTSPCGRLPPRYRFPLHSISESLKATISNGEHLQTGQRTQLLDALYQDVTKFTL